MSGCPNSPFGHQYPRGLGNDPPRLCTQCSAPENVAYQLPINGLLPQVPSPSSELHGTQATTSFYQEQIRHLQRALQESEQENKNLLRRCLEAESTEADLVAQVRQLKRERNKLLKQAQGTK